MLTTSGCRAQSTVWRKRLLRSWLVGLTGLACVLSVAAPARGRAEPLAPWGGPVPSLSLPALDGPDISMRAGSARLVVVHFFATWCETCGPELKALDRLQADLGDAVAILGIDVAEPTDRIRRYFAKAPVRFPVGLDADRSVARAWGVFSLPSTFVLDADLAPRWQVVGDVDWDLQTIRALLASAASPAPRSSQDRSAPTPERKQP